jgi:hypothetical protein
VRDRGGEDADQFCLESCTVGVASGKSRLTPPPPPSPPPCSQLRGNHKAALFFFEKAGRYNHAVRIAREAGLDTELAALALQASKRVQLDAAR